jgi:hypothetical protein
VTVRTTTLVAADPGLTVTVTADDVTGAISQFTATVGTQRAWTLTYARNGVRTTKALPRGLTTTFAPPGGGVKWLTDDIWFSVG